MVVAGVAILLAFILFATNRGSSTNGSVIGAVQVWGSFRPEEIEPLLNIARTQYPDLKIDFTNKPESSLYTEFVNRAATNQSPDLVIVPISEVLSYVPFISPISKASLSDRVVNELFIDGVYPLNTELGMIGVPISINPMLFIANKEYLQSIFVANLPGTWQDLTSLTEQLARTAGSTVEQPVIPLGTISQQTESYGVLLSMFLQARSTLVTNTVGANASIASTEPLVGFRSDIEGASSAIYTSLGSAFEYFSAYARPGSNVFSWNDSLGDPITLFKTKQLPLLMLSYSSLMTNFSLADTKELAITLLPLASADVTVTKPVSYADGYVAVIPKLARNVNGAYGTAFSLIGEDVQQQIPTALKHYPVLKSLLASKKDTPLDEIVRKATIQSVVIPFTSRQALRDLLAKTLASYTSGRLDKEGAILEFSSTVSSILERLQLK